ncbi:hypothetical protein MBGDC06_00274 [Thermoplasmatales archaeon SCGC AB-539-C06]|nr:hypothetical protein MBGDC06_00274 [Thermoplasmatales archaeon SCGC AB-539-C06]
MLMYQTSHFMSDAPSSPFSKTETTIALCVRKIRRKKKEDLLAIAPSVVVAVGTSVDDSQGSLGMVC